MDENNQTSYFKFTDLDQSEADRKLLETTSAPVRALISYYRDQADINDVMRSFTTHLDWFAPLTLFNSPLTDLPAANPAGPAELWIFTDESAVFYAQTAAVQIDRFRSGMRGKELFDKIPPNTQTVRINPYSPPEHSLLLLGDIGIRLAKTWADVIAFEDKIEEWKQAGNPDKTAFLNFRAFITFLDPAGAVFTLNIPGSGLMSSAPLFTAPDCARKFVESDLVSKEQRAGMQQIAVTGEMLFEQSANLRIDGVTINPFGPGPMYFLPFGNLRA